MYSHRLSTKMRKIKNRNLEEKEHFNDPEAKSAAIEIFLNKEHTSGL